jgi:hypothetical protein
MNNVEELRFLSHRFAKMPKDGKPYYLPRLDPERIIASRLYRKKIDAIRTPERYHTAFIHAFVQKAVFKTDAGIYLLYYRKHTGCFGQFLLVDLDRLPRLYYGENVGFANETCLYNCTPGYESREGRQSE